MQEPESKFDIWRHLVREHIVPEKEADRKSLQRAVNKRFHKVPQSDQRAICDCIDKMNGVSCCQLCNTFVGRYDKKESVKKAVDHFAAILDSRIGEETRDLRSPIVHEWLKELGEAVLEVWKAKAIVARGKVKHTRGRFQEMYPHFSLTHEREINRCNLDRKVQEWVNKCIEDFGKNPVDNRENRRRTSKGSS